jgi:hypothetical protein
MLAACSAPSEPRPLSIALTPAAQPSSTAIAVCVPRDAAVSLDVRYAPDVSQYDLVFQLGEPADLPDFIAPIAYDEIVVVLHHSNDLDLDRLQTAAIFTGMVRDWAELGGNAGAIELWVGPESDEARHAFQQETLIGAPILGSAHLVTDLASILQAVAADPAAAGILPAAWTDESVELNELGIELPLLALAGDEPSGAARELLACLQSELGQAALSELYTPLQD